MGFLKHILLGDLGQSWDIVDQQNEQQKLAQANAEIRRKSASQQALQSQRISELENHCAQLHLALTALTRFLTDHAIVHEAELRSFIEQIDASDGAMDGKLSFSDARSSIKLHFPPNPQ